MDQLSEKKWFLYINDRHDGPFSKEEIQREISRGSLTPEHFLWKEGMDSWQVLKEIKDFSSIVPLPSQAQTRSSDLKSQALTSPQAQPTFKEMLQPIEDEKTGDIQPEELHQTRMIAREALERNSLPPQSNQNSPKTIANPTSVQSRNRSIALRMSSLFLILIIAFALFRFGAWESLSETLWIRSSLHKLSHLARPYIIKLSAKLPLLDPLIPPIMKIEDVSVIDYEDLRSAISERLPQKGAQYAIALSQTDTFAPSFYIASNLPDGAQFDLYALGVADTLLNELSFMEHLPATLHRQIAKTSPLRRSDGRPLARGEYDLYLISSLNQSASIKSIIESYPAPPIRIPSELPPGSRILAVKKVFLGGLRDATYQTQLQDFHDKLRARALGELSEIKNHISTLDTQLQGLIQESQVMNKLSRSPLKQKKSWENFQASWLKTQDEFTRLAQSWTPEAIKDEYYYGELYAQVQFILRKIWNLFETETAWVTGQIDQNSFISQLELYSAEISTDINQLNDRVKLLESQTTDKNTPPQRDPS